MKKNPGIAIKLYRVERWCYTHNLNIIAKVIFRLMQLLLGCTIPYTCEIEGGGKNSSFSRCYICT